jgi:hypothetical protein
MPKGKGYPKKKGGKKYNMSSMHKRAKSDMMASSQTGNGRMKATKHKVQYAIPRIKNL